tara:strand:- start:3890 stop:4498 length:609 start_codon:yes stop_codon:yes gene_type:complete
MKETFQTFSGLKIFVSENDQSCNPEDKSKFKCGWDILGTYPKNFPNIDKVYKYNQPNIIEIPKGVKGFKGPKGDTGEYIIPDYTTINLNKINDYHYKDLNIISPEKINLNSINKINLHKFTKICIPPHCFDFRDFKNTYNYLKEIVHVNQDNLKPHLTHPDNCNGGSFCYFDNIIDANRFKAPGQYCEYLLEYDNMIKCYPL